MPPKTVKQLIDSIGKIYYCPLNKNRFVDDTGGVEKYKPIEQLGWNSTELEQVQNSSLSSE